MRQIGDSQSFVTLALAFGAACASAWGQCEPSWVAALDGGAGLNGTVAAMAIYDDGSGGGPALFACGTFTIAGGVSVIRIAKSVLDVWGQYAGTVLIAAKGADGAPV